MNRREFLRTAALSAGGIALSTLPAAANASASVPAARLARLATGANVCRWFRFPRNELPEHFRDYITDAEAEMMARIGLKHVRLCVAPKIIMDASTGVVREDCATFLEAAIKRIHRAGLLVIVDIHNEDRAAELNPDWQTAFVKFWSALANRLAKFDPELTMLEIINEPVFDKREEEWNTLNARLATAIRQSAPRHTIVTSGPNWGGIDGLKKVRLLDDRNVVYSFHCYDPFAFTHQGATWAGDAAKPLRGVPYPSSPEAVAPLLPALEAHPASRGMVEKYGKEQWNKERLAAAIPRRHRMGREKPGSALLRRVRRVSAAREAGASRELVPRLRRRARDEQNRLGCVGLGRRLRSQPQAGRWQTCGGCRSGGGLGPEMSALPELLLWRVGHHTG
jgi:endoglucanase